MSEYVILLPGNDSRFEKANEADRAAMYGRHQEFAEALAARGHKVTGGSELTHSRESKLVRSGADGVVVTDGPYAETVEQLSGFYIVESDDVEDLYKVCGILAGDRGTVEVRAAVVHPGA